MQVENRGTVLETEGATLTANSHPASWPQEHWDLGLGLYSSSWRVGETY